MNDAIGKIDAKARSELAGSQVSFEMKDPMTLQDEDRLFISVAVEGSLAFGNPTDELRDLLTTQVGVHEIAEDTILPGVYFFAVVFVDHPG